ncbi:MAG: tight adherence protein C [Pseudohongiellaceae bacterium]
MPDVSTLIPLLLVLALVAAAAYLAFPVARRSAAIRQLEDKQEQPTGDEFEGRLARWLARAGRTEARAVPQFWVRQGLAMSVGAVLALLVARSSQFEALCAYAADVPGAGGPVRWAIASSPEVIFLMVAFLPMLHVRRERRQRVASIDRDLPVLLELLATLGEAGLGFDAALDRVLVAQPRERPLVREMRQFQQDVLAGMARWRAFRRLGRRCDVSSISMFTSALIQSEQIGSGLAESLRSQSADHWNRRREQALAQAQSLPARLSIPLVFCFLPSLFVITLGPILLDFIKLADSVISPGS